LPGIPYKGSTAFEREIVSTIPPKYLLAITPLLRVVTKNRKTKFYSRVINFLQSLKTMEKKATHSTTSYNPLRLHLLDEKEVVLPSDDVEEYSGSFEFDEGLIISTEDTKSSGDEKGLQQDETREGPEDLEPPQEDWGGVKDDWDLGLDPGPDDEGIG
jgi:hypothetical protein